MDELLLEEMNRTNSIGLAIGVVEDDTLEYTRMYGTKNFELNEPVNANTLFCIASVTKSFICSGILKLQQMNKLRIDDPISQYLPIALGYEDNPIRIRHLMTHTSGIPNLADSMWTRNYEQQFGIERAIPKYPFSSWDDGFRFLNGAQEFTAPPGTRFHYNNFGYGILSKLITEVAGESFKTFLHKHIFEPLEMNRTGFYNRIKGDGNLAEPYYTKPGDKLKKLMNPSYDQIRLTRSLDEAAGGLFSSINELSNYMIMHLNHGVFRGTQILERESITMMQQQQFQESYPNDPFAQTYRQTDSGYGFGFAIDLDFYGTKLVQHSGSFIGASAWFAFIPSERRGVIFLGNHHPSPRMFAQAVLLETLGKDCTVDWPLLKLRKFQEELCGTYETYKGLNQVEVRTRNGMMVIDFGNQNILPICPINGDPFSDDYYHPTETGGKMAVQFIRSQEDQDQIFLHIERDKWRKIM